MRKENLELTHTPVYRRPEYQEINNNVFKPREYAQALELYQDYQKKEKETLIIDDELILENRKAACAAGAILVRKLSPDSFLPVFYESFTNYFDLLKELLRENPKAFDELHTSEPAERLKELIELVLCFEKPDSINEIITQWCRKFSLSSSWERFMLDTLLEKIQQERINFLRIDHLNNTRCLALSYLDYTSGEPLKTQEKNGRVSVMNLMSDMDYFDVGPKRSIKTARTESLNWINQALYEKSDDYYAKTRKNLLMEQDVVEQKVARFEHDTNSTIGLMRNLLDDIKSAGELKQITLPVARLGNCVNRLFVTNQVIQEVPPVLKQTLLKPVIEELKVIHGNELTIDYAQDEETPALYTDAQSLSLVLDNLLKNSQEAFQRKKIQGKCRVQLRANSRQITYEDNAGGIEESSRTRIFEAYFSSKNEIRVSCGLGLYNSKKIMESLQGSISLPDSQPEKGSRFILRFPEESVPDSYL